MLKEKYNFKGFDWTEIIDYYDESILYSYKKCENFQEISDDEKAEDFLWWMETQYNSIVNQYINFTDNMEKLEELYEPAKAFIKALSSIKGCCSSIWEAISEAKGDCFFYFFSKHLMAMWV